MTFPRVTVADWRAQVEKDLAGVPFTKIRHIFITHNHDDHNADWGTLMGRAWSDLAPVVAKFGPRRNPEKSIRPPLEPFRVPVKPLVLIKILTRLIIVPIIRRGTTTNSSSTPDIRLSAISSQ
jgi:mRNA degradation ribonuclease J1/J2